MSLVSRVICIALMVFPYAAAQDLTLQPRVIEHSELVSNDFWFSAPYVLAVRIVGYEVKGPPKRIMLDKETELQLVEFVAEVETVLKGTSIGGRIRFYFFAIPSQQPTYFLSSGARYIVSLRHEGRMLRSMADGTQLAIRVFSGRHDEDSLPVGLSISELVSYVLLTPGREMDLQSFRDNLLYSVGRTTNASQQYVASLMKQLLSNPDKSLGDGACVAMAHHFSIRPDCLSAITMDSSNASLRLLPMLLRQDEPKMVNSLREDVLSSLSPIYGRYMTERLQLFTEDSRPEIRRVACEKLETLLPHREFPNCN